MDPSATARAPARALAPLDAFVLAAGLGTRIGRLSRHRPKPLLPVGATTPLEHAVARLRVAGARRVVVNAAHLAEQIVARGAALGIEVVVERAPTGTAGGLAAARGRLDADRVAVWNGDILADVDVARLVSALDEDDRALAALAVHDLRAPGHGNVGLSADGRVVRLRQQRFPALGEEAHGALFSAVHVLARPLVERAPAEGCLVSDVYLPALAEGRALRAVAWSGAWHDIGDPASYLAANLAQLAPLASVPSDGRRASLVLDGAEVSPEVTLESSIIGAGARIVGQGALREVVVWPGATIEAPRARVIAAFSDGETEIIEV